MCPFGMVKFVLRLLDQESTSHKFSILPISVKEAFSLKNSDSYDPKLMTVTCSDEGFTHCIAPHVLKVRNIMS